MYHSKEIRWFFQQDQAPLAAWFLDLGLKFDDVTSRTDYYHLPTLTEALGIKLREGRIEIKQRMSGPETSILVDGMEGYLEEWIKWSYDVQEDDAQISAVLSGMESDHWLEVHKTRMAVKLGNNQSGTLKIHNIDEYLEIGCQVEYTQLELSATRWYTFGLEWFGKPWLEVDPEIFRQILSEIRLSKEEAWSYPRFLIGQRAL